MAEKLKLSVITATFDKPLDARRGFSSLYSTADRYFRHTNNETLGFAVIPYSRTVLGPNGTAIYSDYLVSVITPSDAKLTNSGVYQAIMLSKGVLLDIMRDAFLHKGIHPEHPAAIITADGNTHLLSLTGEGAGQGYVNYLTRFPDHVKKAA